MLSRYRSKQITNKLCTQLRRVFVQEKAVFATHVMMVLNSTMAISAVCKPATLLASDMDRVHHKDVWPYITPKTFVHCVWRYTMEIHCNRSLVCYL